MITKFKIFESKVKKHERVNIYRDENFIVIRPLTTNAACKYGAYTSWCISAPGNAAFDVGKDKSIVIIVINKNYNVENVDDVKRLNYLNDLINQGEYTEEQHDEYLEMLSEEKGIDLSKIAIIYNKNGRLESIWDANNIELTDNYPFGINELPIPEKIKSQIENYIDSEVNEPILELGETEKYIKWTGPEEVMSVVSGKQFNYYFEIDKWDYKMSIIQGDYPYEFWVGFRAKLHNDDDYKYDENIITNTGKIFLIMSTINNILKSNYDTIKKIFGFNPIYKFTGVRKKGEIGISKRNKLYIKFLTKKFPNWEIQQLHDNGQMKIITK